MGFILVFKKNLVYYLKFNFIIYMYIFDLFILVIGVEWLVMVVIVVGFRLGFRILIVLFVEFVNIVFGE